MVDSLVRRQASTRTGSSIGQRGLHLAFGNLLEHHRNRLGTGEPEKTCSEQGKNDNNNDDTAHVNP
jgi:hypothetical protein